MTDEADNDTMCFSAKGDNNETIWGEISVAANGCMGVFKGSI